MFDHTIKMVELNLENMGKRPEVTFLIDVLDRKRRGGK